MQQAVGREAPLAIKRAAIASRDRKKSTMCPECFAPIALAIAGVISTGGITAATVKLLRNKKLAAKISQLRTKKEKAT